MVIIIDGSDSFKARQNEAINQSISLPEKMASREIHRWERSVDQVTLINLDAIPEILWAGSARELKAMEPDFWGERFESRTDYSKFTDVCGAFDLAIECLSDADPSHVRKYIFVFSDLIDQPPPDMDNRPSRANKLPTGEFPWTELKNISVCGF